MLEIIFPIFILGYLLYGIISGYLDQTKKEERFIKWKKQNEAKNS